MALLVGGAGEREQRRQHRREQPLPEREQGDDDDRGWQRARCRRDKKREREQPCACGGEPRFAETARESADEEALRHDAQYADVGEQRCEATAGKAEIALPEKRIGGL